MTMEIQNMSKYPGNVLRDERTKASNTCRRAKLPAAFIAILLFSCQAAFSAGTTWIWYPGDFEIWLSNKVQTKRTERDATIPPFWRLYGHQPNVVFSKIYDTAAPEQVQLSVDGIYGVTIDGVQVQGDQRLLTLPAGKHTISIQVFNQAAPPAIHVAGKEIFSDESWVVGLSAGHAKDGSKPTKAARWQFDDPNLPPSRFKLSTREIHAESIERSSGSMLVDFGRETIGFVKLAGIQGKGKISLYYGESREEALSTESTESFDHLTLNGERDFIATRSRAMRYVNVRWEAGINIDTVALLYEYLPMAMKGEFKSSDQELNRIWDVAARTLELNSREFYLDGIKRDHWLWSGDATQTYLMNYYSYFDRDAVKRTTWALRGGDPVEIHINTILEYSLYWLMGIADYYKYSGDSEFVKSIYPRMVSMMDFVLSRRNENGMLQGRPGDWVFIDWAPMPKDGELSVVQILLARSLEAMALSASVAHDPREEEYRRLADELKHRTMEVFWDKQREVFFHSRKDGKLDPLVTRYPHIFALMFGYLDEKQANSAIKNVLMNSNAQAITTPYMSFYELDALAAIGQHAYVAERIKSYWGGMLREGATCFWELYDPRQNGTQHYSMYNRPFGKSLCHAWGAGPLYLLGRHYLGVHPTSPGYATYVVEPNLGNIEWLEGKVPTPDGEISVSISRKNIKVSSGRGSGKLRFRSVGTPTASQGELRRVGPYLYELDLIPTQQYVVNYQASRPSK